MATIVKVVGYSGTVEKQKASRGVSSAYIAKVTDGPQSSPFSKRKDAEAWLHKHAKAISVHYRAQVRVKGRSESATFPRKKDAQEWAASSEAAIREGKHFPHRASRRVTFEELVALYVEKAMPGKIPSKSARNTRKQQLEWWVDRFKGMTVADLASAESTAIIDARDELAAEKFTKRRKPLKDRETGKVILPVEYERSAATVNRYVAALSAVMSYAVNDRRLITSNPVRKGMRKSEPRGRTEFLTNDQRTSLLDACAKSKWPALRTLVLLAITSGARRGEMTSLKWTDLDLDAGRALVSETKNDEQRVLTLKGEALKALRAMKAERDEKPEDQRDEYVFTNPSGHPGEFKFFDDYWYEAMEAAGIEKFRFHDLRHTCATYLAEQGDSLLMIAAVLGHKTLAMTKRYAHLVEAHRVSSIEKMIASRPGL